MNRVERLLASPVGALVARPWFDRFTIRFFERLFFPSSRLWAAARAAHGSTESFFEQVPMQPVPRARSRLSALLSHFEQVRRGVVVSEALWQEAFFGSREMTFDEIAIHEDERLARRAGYNGLRRKFTFLTRQSSVPSVKWEISSPMELAADYAAVIHGEHGPFAAPDAIPAIETSRCLQISGRTDYWLRFESPSTLADTVYARVSEPEGIEDPPTIVFLHGIGVEFDHWYGMIDEADRLVAAGFRVVRPESPWHGRRVPDGRYGGEKFIATLPRGTLEFSSAQVREVAVLLDWARNHSAGPLALGGSSLGAHIARVAAASAQDWPQRLHPDALFLITPCGRLEDAAIEGSFAKIWGTAEAAGEQGWSPVLRSKWLSLIDPRLPSVVPPDSVVTVLGRHDRVTPFESGWKLIGELGIPRENVFSWPLGHFSIPINMVRDRSPINRLRQIMNGTSGS
jgi:pimeloyl-ACP methyl ester carboxylesterase